MQHSEALQNVLSKVGGRRRLAELTGVTYSAVAQWEDVPVDRVAAVAAATELCPRDIRPDLAKLFEDAA